MGYEYTTRIRYSETDGKGFLKPDHLANYFQDCAIFHDQDCGLGTKYWIERNAMWVLTSWKILMFRMPEVCDEVRVGTQPYEFKRVTGFRNFTMRDKDGKMLCAASSKWALLGLGTSTPAKIDPKEVEAYGIGPGLPIEEDNGRITVPEEAVKYEPFEVAKHHLDANRHVNNVQYIQMATDYLPRHYHAKVMRVSYHKSAQFGEMLYPAFYSDGHTVTGYFTDAEGEPYALFRFMDAISDADQKIAAL